MASWLVRSSPDRSDPGSSPGTSKKFSHPESRGIISNLMITELFYLHTLSITRSSLHTRFFRSIHRSVFRYRFTKIWPYRPEKLAGLSRNVPWQGTLCCVPRQGTLLLLCLSPPRCTNGYGELLGNLKNYGEMTCDGLASRPRGVVILPAASCLRNQDKLWQLRTSPFGSKASLSFIWLSRPIIVNHVDAHFEALSICIAIKSIQGFSVR